QHALGERLPRTRLWTRAERGEHIVDVRTEVLVRDVATAVADQPPLPGQQPLQSEPVERWQHHPLGQVARRAEQDEDRRAWAWAWARAQARARARRAGTFRGRHGN